MDNKKKYTNQRPAASGQRSAAKYRASGHACGKSDQHSGKSAKSSKGSAQMRKPGQHTGSKQAPHRPRPSTAVEADKRERRIVREGRLLPGSLYCPIDRRCGGCMLLSVPYEDQLLNKQALVNALFAGFCDADTVRHEICGMADPRYYRNKVVSPFVGVYDRKARKQRILCGMYERGTHRVIDSTECLIENRLAKAIILSVRDLMPKYGIEPYDEDADTGFLRHAMVRVGHTSGEVMLTLVTREERFPASKNFVRELKRRHPEITTVVQNINTHQTNVILGQRERVLYGPGFILDTLCGLSFRISSQSFYQVNVTQTEVLYTRAIEMAHLSGTETVIDAYCGTGTIGLVAARGVDGRPGAARVIGVEERPDAVTDAINNARHNGVYAAEFVTGDAGEFMRERAGALSADVLLMDPPRSGATPDFLKAACTMGPSRIVYISCNPHTQVRDVKYLVEHGYRIAEIQAVDMFPHTEHVESIVSLEKVPEGKPGESA